jgi:hypothetical protein
MQQRAPNCFSEPATPQQRDAAARALAAKVALRIARAAYGRGSRLSKIMTVSSERSPERFNFVLLDQAVGF